MVQWLVEQGLDINEKDKFGRTVMHWAAMRDSVEVIQWLVEQGLDINATDNDGETPLDKAIASGFWGIDTAQCLREHGGKESKDDLE